MDKIEALALSEYYSRKAKALNGELPKDIEDDDQYKEDISLGDKEALKRALYRQDLKAEEDQDAREIELAAEKLRNITQTPGKLN